MFIPTKPNNIAKTQAVVNELKIKLNSRKNILQKGEKTLESTGQNTRRNLSANKQYMNQLRRGTNNQAKATTIKSKPVVFSPYIKVSGVKAGIMGLSCTPGGNGSYICTPV